jgi:ribosomal protein L11 methyltransferase
MLLPDIPGKLKDDGYFLASGLIEERMDDVEAAAVREGLRLDAVDHRGGWVVMQFVKA